MTENNSVSILIETYLAELDRVITKSKPTDGLFGFGSSVKNHPCHEQFFDAVGEAVAGIADEEEAGEAARAILYADSSYDCPNSAKLMLTAIQGHIKKLIPLLSEEDKAEIKAYYDLKIPRGQRLPVQKEVYNMLK